MKKWSRKDVEDAALICSARSAGLSAMRGGYWTTATREFAEASGIDDGALQLAHAARDEASNSDDVLGFVGQWAEAEALLRTGWLP